MRNPKQRTLDSAFRGRLFFLRHGQTLYTEIPPDLTDQGKETIKASADTIGCQTNGDELMIICSPRARTMGSGHIIKRELRISGPIVADSRIREAQVYAKEAGATIYHELVAKGEEIQPGYGSDYLSICYGTDPRYEDPTIIEPRTQVQKRFFEYLKYAVDALLLQLGTGKLISFIHVTHYEFLYHFVEKIFRLDYSKDRPLLHGEVVIIDVFKSQMTHFYELEVTFRDETETVFFNTKTKAIVFVG